MSAAAESLPRPLEQYRDYLRLLARLQGVITVATDAYGLGAVLYAVLAGRPPFQGDSMLETIAQVKDRAVDPPSNRGRRIDSDLETICLKCLERDRAAIWCASCGTRPSRLDAAGCSG